MRFARTAFHRCPLLPPDTGFGDGRRAEWPGEAEREPHHQIESSSSRARNERHLEAVRDTRGKVSLSRSRSRPALPILIRQRVARCLTASSVAVLAADAHAIENTNGHRGPTSSAIGHPSASPQPELRRGAVRDLTTKMSKPRHDRQRTRAIALAARPSRSSVTLRLRHAFACFPPASSPYR